MLENFILSAHAHGLGTCAQGAVITWDDVIRKEFAIPNDYRLLSGLAIGYASADPINSFGAHRIGFEEIELKKNR